MGDSMGAGYRLHVMPRPDIHFCSSIKLASTIFYEIFIALQPEEQVVTSSRLHLFLIILSIIRDWVQKKNEVVNNISRNKYIFGK